MAEYSEASERVAVLAERVRVMRIVRGTKPRDAVQDNEMARMCVELFRADVLDAIAEVP